MAIMSEYEKNNRLDKLAQEEEQKTIRGLRSNITKGVVNTLPRGGISAYVPQGQPTRELKQLSYGPTQEAPYAYTDYGLYDKGSTQPIATAQLPAQKPEAPSMVGFPVKYDATKDVRLQQYEKEHPRVNLAEMRNRDFEQLSRLPSRQAVQLAAELARRDERKRIADQQAFEERQKQAEYGSAKEIARIGAIEKVATAAAQSGGGDKDEVLKQAMMTQRAMGVEDKRTQRAAAKMVSDQNIKTMDLSGTLMTTMLNNTSKEKENAIKLQFDLLRLAQDGQGAIRDDSINLLNSKRNLGVIKLKVQDPTPEQQRVIAGLEKDIAGLEASVAKGNKNTPQIQELINKVEQVATMTGVNLGEVAPIPQNTITAVQQLIGDIAIPTVQPQVGVNASEYGFDIASYQKASAEAKAAGVDRAYEILVRGGLMPAQALEGAIATAVPNPAPAPAQARVAPQTSAPIDPWAAYLDEAANQLKK